MRRHLFLVCHQFPCRYLFVRTKMTMLQDEDGSKLDRAPFLKPLFTVGQLKRAVPRYCFRRSLLMSCSYLFVDLAVIAALLYGTTFIPESGLLAWAGWITYWCLQGCVATGVWVIAHECGHQAFSELGWVNDSVGLFLHSCLMVPYFSWKYSHRRHHSNTGSVEKDEVFVPKGKQQIQTSAFSKFLRSPPGRLLNIAVMLTLGWPMYLACNVSGRKYDGFASHFHPTSPIFGSREQLFVGISDVSLAAVVLALYRMVSAWGFVYVAKVYAVPLLIVNAFLVLITFLQHTHPALPHYESSEWDWLRGALATVDRDWGLLNQILHHITDTHVVHHIFPTIPHYHAVEATKSIRPLLGSYYKYDDTPVLQALWREMRECVYVESDDGNDQGVLWFNKKLP